MTSSTLPPGFSMTAPRISEEGIAREKTVMSHAERAALQRDIYGVTHPSDKSGTDEQDHDLENTKLSSITPGEALSRTSLVESRQRENYLIDMEALGRELSRLVSSPREDTAAYERALNACPAYAQSPSFCAEFLKAEQFDFEKAAKRIMSYWKFKIQLFGEEVGLRPRPVCLDDLTNDDLATLNNQGLELLPKKDKSGRRILVSTRRNWIFVERENVARLFWYLFHVSMEDTVDGGLILVLFDDGPFNLRENYDRKLDKLVVSTATTLPTRVLSIHHCVDHPVMEIVLPMFWFVLGSDWRRRYMIYKGRNHHRSERMAKFQEYGMSASVLPTRMGGTLESDIEEWKAERRRKERIE